ncbi:MAG: hypothetical protein ACRC62_15285 [Microcoleus sp.]
MPQTTVRKTTNDIISIARLVSNAPPTQVTVTCTLAALVGDTTVSLSGSVTGKTFFRDEIISFSVATTEPGFTSRRVIAIVNQDSFTLGTTATTCAVLPLTNAIAAASTAPTWVGLQPLRGISNIPLTTDAPTEQLAYTSNHGRTATLVNSLTKGLNTTYYEFTDRAPADALLRIIDGQVDRNVFIVYTNDGGDVLAGIWNVGPLSDSSSEVNSSKAKSVEFMLQGLPTTDLPGWVLT